MRGSCQAPHSTERMQRYAFSLNYASISPKTCILHCFFCSFCVVRILFQFSGQHELVRKPRKKGKKTVTILTICCSKPRRNCFFLNNS